MDTNHPYYKAPKPHSAFELFRWMLQEPLRVEAYGKECTRKETVIWILKVYCFCIVPLTIFLWFLLMNSIVFFDTPTLLKAAENTYFIETLASYNYSDKLFLVLSETYTNLAFGLVLGLVSDHFSDWLSDQFSDHFSDWMENWLPH